MIAGTRPLLVTALAVSGTVALSLVAAYGDYLLKTASMETQPFKQASFAGGCFAYAATAVGWIYVMRHLKLSAIGAIFSVSMTTALVFIGLLAFKEALRAREIVGLVFALLSIVLLSRS